MKRRVFAVAAAAATALAVLPVAPAFAAAAATGNLVGTTAHYPGTDRQFTIRVTNNEMPVLGKTINGIRVNFPVTEAGITLGSGPGTAAGFTEAKSTKVGTTQFNTYKGGSLRPGTSVDISFPATILAPNAKDLLGDFRVQVTSDNFATLAPAAGSLVAKVQVLEILQEGLKPIAPTNSDNTKGVTDRTGTAGQAITYQSTIRNYAQSALDVAAGLSSSAGDLATPATVSVPGGGQATAQIPVTLGNAASDRTSAFIATAETADKSAVAPTRTDSFTVQAPANLVFSKLDPTRVKSGTGSAKDFTTDVAKSGTPAVDTANSTLTFGTNSASTTGSFGRGAGTGKFTFKFLEIVGTDGTYPTTVNTSITDDNLASYADPVDKLADIVIDNLAPIVDLNVILPKDLDGDQQIAVKNGDTISVSGTLANAGDYAANSLKVTLRPNAGDPVNVPVTVSGSGDSRTFSGSVKHKWDTAATSFTSEAQAADTAGNFGTDTAGTTIIDNVIPKMIGDGVVLEPSLIEVTFADATGVSGGCDPNMWLIDGVPGQVTAVKDASGGDCNELGTGGRLLTLREPLEVDDTPRVTYEIAGKRVATTLPVKDGAGNDADRQTVETVTNLVPQAPVLVKLERRDGTATAAFENAYQDPADGNYYTNVSGTDVLRLTVSGIRQNYTLQVLKDGKVVAERAFTAAPPLGASSYSGDITFPLAAGDGPSDFTAQFVSAVGNIGAGTKYRVVLDTVLPTLKPATISGSTVTVPFSEKIVSGSDFADNWFVSETVQTETGTAERTVNANSVTGGDELSRTLDVTLVDTTKFTDADYLHQSGTAYEDRAGNVLANTLV
jgi:hypothetical protein